MKDVRKIHSEVAKTFIEGRNAEEIQKMIFATEAIAKKTKILITDFDKLFIEKWNEYCELMRHSPKVREIFAESMKVDEVLAKELSDLFMRRFNKKQGPLSFLRKGEIGAIQREENKIVELRNERHQELQTKLDSYYPTVLKKVMNNKEIKALLTQFPLEIEIKYPEKKFKISPISRSWTDFFDNFKSAHRPEIEVKNRTLRWVVEFTDDVVSAMKAEIPLVKRKQANARLKAQASKNKESQRNLMSSFRTQREYTFQLKRADYCPYCEKKFETNLLDSTVHLDHIYPVSKGGQSILENLVFICSACNTKKSNITLAIFCSQNGLDREKVTSQLLKLGKEV